MNYKSHKMVPVKKRCLLKITKMLYYAQSWTITLENENASNIKIDYLERILKRGYMVQ